MEKLAKATPSAPATPPADGSRVDVELTFEGVGQLHQGYFRESQALTGLSNGLGGTLTEDAQVIVHYSQKELKGGIRLRIPPGALARPPRVSGELVDLAALAPITRALASYRGDLGARFDVRINNFTLGLDFVRGSLHCAIGLGGPPPPDGTVVSPCVQIGGQEVCGAPGPEGVKFPPDAAEKLAVCLR